MFSALNTEEYWSTWIGIFCFCILITVRACANVGPIDLVSWTLDKEFSDQININFLISLLCIISLIVISLIVCHKALDKRIDFFNYFTIIGLVIISKIIGTFSILKSNGLGTSFLCIVFGCLYRLCLGDGLLNDIMSMEFFIKISIVLFAIDIQNIVTFGPKAIVVAWIDTIILLMIVYFIGSKLLQLDNRISLLISSGLSVCGSSAIMTLSDIIYKPNFTEQQLSLQQEQLSLQKKQDTHVSITILSIFSIPFIPLMPYVCKVYGLNDAISGLWIGGTIDSTGTVIASVSLLGQNALNSAVVLKMLQNLLIGPIALVLTIIWNRTVNFYVLWDKFPKFVFGFILISVVVSLLPTTLRTQVSSDCFIISEWFSAISFVLIGLDIDFFHNELFKQWRLMLLYIIGQTIDIFTTFGFVWLMFT
jgi:uncharacterized membrane protein YadS